MEEKTTETVKKGNVKALLPIGVFLVLYLGLGILFEYGMGIPMGFYNIPVVVIFLVALLVACFQNRKLPFDDKLTIMGRGMGDKTIVTMVLIFMVAGIFVGTVGRDSAESVAYLLLSVVPVQFAVAVLFVVSCFVSLSMGTVRPLPSSRFRCPARPARSARAVRRSAISRESQQLHCRRRHEKSRPIERLDYSSLPVRFWNHRSRRFHGLAEK